VTQPIPVTEVDSRVRELIDRGDVSAAAALFLDKYGPDVFGFLSGVLEDTRVARATYKGFVKRVSAELPAFQWKCSPRVWLYYLARRELEARRSSATRSESKQVGETEVWRDAGLIKVIGAVRRTLSEEERELLILRVDRLLDWYSLAITRLGETAMFAAIVTEARVLRKRIERLLERIESLTTVHLRLR
jgi:hypothetical protein